MGADGLRTTGPDRTRQRESGHGHGTQGAARRPRGREPPGGPGQGLGRRGAGGHGRAARRRDADGRRALGRDPAAPEPEEGLRLPRLRLARGGATGSIAEFCENGAKAVAEEATLRRVTPDVLRRALASPTSAGAAATGSGQQGRLTDADAAGRGRRRTTSRSAGTRRFGLIAARAQRPGLPRRGGLLHLAAARPTRPRSSTSCSCAPSAPTTCPTARTCATSPAARRSPRPSASARARCRWPTSAAPTCILVVGQNPGTNHPRMLSALEKAKRGGAKITAVNPLPEAGLLRFKNPQNAVGRRRARHAAGRPVPADQGRRRPGAVPGLRQADAGGRGRRPGHRARPRPSSTPTRTASRTTPRRRAAPAGRRSSTRPA